jgi:hypothetical protein
MSKKVFALAMVCAACSMPPVQVSVGPLQVEIKQPVRPAGEPQPGRYQVLNPAAPMMRSVMLLDTATGDTWVLCEVGNESNWCDMHRGSYTQTGMKTR